MPKQSLPPESDILKRVQVRLILPEERGRFDQLLEKEHYLHSSRLGGQSLRYIAEQDGQWVALISFSAPALNIKPREKWMDWNPRQRARRLTFLVNNSRFLVLPERKRYPNLASRVLSLCLKRLSYDWEEHWGHPVLVVESFVDESQDRGICYRACGFEAVGCSSGYGRSSRDFRRAVPKGVPMLGGPDAKSPAPGLIERSSGAPASRRSSTPAFSMQRPNASPSDEMPMAAGGEGKGFQTRKGRLDPLPNPVASHRKCSISP